MGIPEVLDEVEDIMTKHNAGTRKSKSSTRKYAFELPEVPKEADYLKLMYSYESKYGYDYGL